MTVEPGAIKFKFLAQEFILSPNKVLYWADQKTMIISDVHLGKANHFRKFGIAVPATVHISDQDKIEKLINIYQPLKIIFLGDLFHSDHNLNWPLFNSWLEDWKDIQFILVKGNHDILPHAIYEDSPLVVVDSLLLEPFLFTHDKTASNNYNISGHVHPAIMLKGKARQSIRLACFHFSEKHALMPAFGGFTGFANIKVKPGGQVFALTDDKVIEMP